MKRELLLSLLLFAAGSTIALGQQKFTVAADPVNVAPGGRGTGIVKDKYQCDNCTTPYSGGLEFFQSFSPGFERDGDPTFACDPGPSCSITGQRCLQFPTQYACFAQALLAPGATVTETQTIKQQTGGPATGEWKVEFGNDIGTILLTVPLSVTTTSACPTITIRPDTLPEMTVGVPAEIRFLAENGTPLYTWQFDRFPSEFPAGLGIGGFPNNPVIRGAPLTAATLDFKVTVTDSTPSPPGPCTASKKYTLTVKPAPGPHFVIVKSGDSAPAATDGSFEVTFALTITNDGNGAGTATVDDTILDFSVITLPSTCSASIFFVQCKSGQIQPGAQQEFKFKVKYEPKPKGSPFPKHPRNYSNKATVTTDQTGAKSESKSITISTFGVPNRFLQPVDEQSLRKGSGRKR